MTTLVIVAVCLLVLAVVLWMAAMNQFRQKRWLAGAVWWLFGLVFLAFSMIAGLITVGIQGYRALTYEEVAATVKTEPVAPQRFRATITLPNRRLAMYELAGDAFYVDAHILKWHPWLNVLGLHTSYELDRVAGRYNAIADERAKPHTAYELGREHWFDLFEIARRKALGPLVDAEYGSAAFVAGTRPAEWEVRVSTTGLLMRQVLHSSTP